VLRTQEQVVFGKMLWLRGTGVNWICLVWKWKQKQAFVNTEKCHLVLHMVWNFFIK
jgi:hypothetical protein